MAHDWSSAYLLQAFYDYKMLRRIEIMADVEDAQKIYFLLKMGEKAAQSYLTDGHEAPVKDHFALPRFIKHALKSDPLLRCRIKAKHKYSEFVKKIEKIENYVTELHRLVATSEKFANCEYPYRDTSGAIKVPSEEDFSVIGPSNAPLLRKYIGVFEMVFDASGLRYSP